MDTETSEKSQDQPRLLRRSFNNRILGGVAAGIAKYFALDVLSVRVALVVLTLFAGASVPLYLAAWVLVPEEGSNVALVDGFLPFAPCHRA
jgi:phage shock protein PspC (stress-responsive transcriptional regulator)